MSSGMKVCRDSWPEWKGNRGIRSVQVGALEVGAGPAVIIAGPCAVESLEQTLEIAEACVDSGADMLRGGAFKPRTDPYSFQGLAEKGLEILAEARDRTGLPIVTEVMDTRKVEVVAQYADVLQIGSRNMQNFPLLIEAGKTGKPILLKRGWSATIKEWLGAAEYIAAQGNLDIMLCERGIRTFAVSEYSRNTLDLNVIPALRKRTFLPIIVDPSHATGDKDFVAPAGLAGLAMGGDGLIIEVIGAHTDRAAVKCDGAQGIRPDVLRKMIATGRLLFGTQAAGTPSS